MESSTFDRLTRSFASRLSRRRALAAGGAALSAGLLTADRVPTAAQEATPAATPGSFPGDPHPSTDTARTHPEFLFEQTFDAGTWAPKPGEDGTYTLTLTGAAANTTYFSDRPERITGLAPTQQFLDGLGFTPENPPNAALVIQTDDGEQDILIIELLDPVYDPATATLTYDARVLADYGERGLAFLAQQQSDYDAPETFGQGSLFIDDCVSPVLDQCWLGCDMVGTVWAEYCFFSATNSCELCSNPPDECYYRYALCQDNNQLCADDIELCGTPGCGNSSNCAG
jgi:hypothetical protein